MKTLRLIPSGTKVDFIGRRHIAFVFSALLMVASIGAFAVEGLNLGIDFLGGILIEVRDQSGPADIADLRGRLSGLGLGEVQLQEFGEPEEVLIRLQRQEGDEKAQAHAIEAVKAELGDGFEYRRTEYVGPKVGDELKEAAALAVLFAVGAILLYIWFRFEWQFGLAAVVALVHDVISTIGIFALLQIEFNLATVAAILTIAGYSINDTVVVFDRVRENLRKYKKLSSPELLNLSVNGTLSRTVVTSLTTLLALLAIYLFGGEVIRGFAFALIWGIVIGTYSSIFIAAPVLMMLGMRQSVTQAGEGAEAQA
jgi:preprotein translocase subunit SecF